VLRASHVRRLEVFRAIAERLWREESGQDLVEYVLLVTLIALGLTAALDRLGGALYRAFRDVAVAILTGRWDPN
jgi:Flp pilus assembly pilin Flp